jgi:hypothetical protein
VRFKYTVVVLLIVVAATATTSTGQEEPLPAIQAKGSFEPLSPQIVLAVEPIHAPTPPTLAEAVRANDYVTFDALYRAKPNPAFATLYELWTYSISDPIGAFYGREMHDRFASAYPGYASYIEQYRIVDRNGNVFYPTSETRTFLLERAMEGRAARVLVAETPKAPARARVSGAGAPASRRTARVSTPIVTPAPTRAAAQDAAASAGEDTSAPVTKPVAAVAAETPAVVAAPVAETTPVVETQAPAQQQPAVQPIAADHNTNFGNRGILLLVIGLIGIGLLAMMLRTPREVQPTSILPTENRVTPPPVEPIRRPRAAPPQPQQQTPEKNRATGSHR